MLVASGCSPLDVNRDGQSALYLACREMLGL